MKQSLAHAGIPRNTDKTDKRVPTKVSPEKFCRFCQLPAGYPQGVGLFTTVLKNSYTSEENQ
jgi:hypothetical protein